MAKLIVSAFRATNSLIENYQQHESLIQQLKAVTIGGARPVLSIGVGSFKEEGQPVAAQELCIVADFEVVFAKDRDNLTVSILTTYEQDAALYVTNSGSAYLLTFDGAYILHEYIGEFTAVSEEEAKASECFTYVNGEYYVCK